jgi:hypothetical protein
MTLPRPTLVLLATLLGGGAAVTLPSTPAYADRLGTLRGRVTDAAGNALQGVLVRTTSPELQGIREARTSAAGDYWLPGLPPGIYEVVAILEGYRVRQVRDLEVGMGGSLTIDLRMENAEIEAEVVVEDARPVIDTRSTTTGASHDREDLRNLPVGQSYQSALSLTPGVTGGGNPNVKGAANNENRWVINGMNTTDPVTGTFGTNFANCAIKEIKVKTGNFSAEDGGTLGGIFQVETQSGGDELHGEAMGYYTDSRWSPKRDAVYAPDGRAVEGSEYDRDSSSFTLEACAGGPILRQRIWGFAALTYNRSLSTSFGGGSPRVFDGYQLFSKFTISPSNRHRVEVTLGSAPAKIKNTSQGGTAYLIDPDAQTHQAQNSLFGTLEYNAYPSDRVHLQFAYDHFNSTVDATPMPCTWSGDERFRACKEGEEEGTIDFVTPGHIGSGGARSTVNAYTYSMNRRNAEAVRGAVSLYLPRALGTHEVKLGATVRWTSARSLFGYTGNLYYVDYLRDSGDPTSTVMGYWRESNGQLYQENRGETIFGFLQDSWEPVRGLTIQAGLKYDRSTMRNDVGERIVGFDAVTPVAGVSWDPTREEKAKLYLGGGVYSDAGRLGISSFLDKSGIARKLYLGPYFDGRDSNYSFDQYVYVRSQSNYNRAEKLTFPRSYALTFGFDALVAKKTRVGIEAAASFARHIWEDDENNLIWNGSGTNTIGSINGVQEDFFRLRTPNSGSRNYFSLTLRFERTWWERLYVDAYYTASISRGVTGGQITEALDNPTQAPYEFGWLGTDRPHVVNVMLGWKTPIGLSFSGTWNLVSGSRFDRQYTSDKLGGYAVYQQPVGTYDAIATTWTLNAQIAYELNVRVGRIRAQVNLTNVTNNRAATGISGGTLNSSGEYFASSRQAPMGLTVGVGYVF